MIRTRNKKHKKQKLIQPKARVHISSAKASIYQFNRKSTVQKQHRNYFLNISWGKKMFTEREKRMPTKFIQTDINKPKNFRERERNLR